MKTCETCRFWRNEAKRSYGECYAIVEEPSRDDVSAKLVNGKYSDEAAALMTRASFHCAFHELPTPTEK